MPGAGHPAGPALRDRAARGRWSRLLATDPAARSDVPAWCRMRGHELVETTDEPDYTAYLVRN